MIQMLPQAAIARLNELANEEQFLEKAGIGQVGTSIPLLFSNAETFISNPSNVGTSILARMIETDDTISSAVQFKILMILAKIGEYHHSDEKIRKFVNDFLGKLKEPTWEETMEAMLSCKAFGFSVSEIVFGLDRQMNKIPLRIPTYHPSTIAFETDASGQITEDGVLQFVLQYSQQMNPSNRFSVIQSGYNVRNPFTTPVDRLMPFRIPGLQNYGMVRIPRKKVILHGDLAMFSFGSPYGKTAVRTAHLVWQLKIFFMKQLGIAGKRQATPTLWAASPQGGAQVKIKTPDGQEKQVTPTEAMKILLAARETDDALITGPKQDGDKPGYHLEVLKDEANLDGFLNAINNFNVWLFRCFLLPSLVMTDGSAGSRSLGDKHFQIVDRVAESDAQKFGKKIVNDMIEAIIRENFGEQDDYGKFNPRPQSVEERERLANIFNSLATTGWMQPHIKSDMDHVRSALSLPEVEDKDFDLNFGKGEGDEDAGEPIDESDSGGKEASEDQTQGE